MPEESKDMRKSRRHYFAPEEEMIGIFFVKEHNKRITFKISNISSGGLYFSSKRDKNIELLKDGPVFLEAIKGKSSLCFTNNIELLIRWVLDEKILEHVGFGCKFVDLPEPLFKEINDFVTSQIKKDKG